MQANSVRDAGTFSADVDRRSGNYPLREALAAVAEQAARRSIGAAAILKGGLAVDRDGVVAFGALDSAPFATWEVAHDLHRLDRQLVEIVNDDISPSSLQRAYRDS
jgi:hypothetical protein